MAENRLNRAFIRPVGKEKGDSDAKEIRVDSRVAEMIAAGMNSGDFEQTIKAYAMLDRVSKRLLCKGKIT